MAERFQYQYTPVVGPVFIPPPPPFDPQNLEWLPRGQQPARTLPPNRLGDFVRPEFEALYKHERLEWIPSGQQPARGFPPNRLGDFGQPPFEALYKPDGLQWLASDRYFGLPLPRALLDWTVLQREVTPAYDPADLAWTPDGWPAPTPVEVRQLGYFAWHTQTPAPPNLNRLFIDLDTGHLIYKLNA